MKIFSLFLIILLANPVLAEPSDIWVRWVPTGWKLKSSTTGDLNRDGLSDAALVIEQNNPENFLPNEELGSKVLNVNPRRLLILFNTPQGYKKVVSRDDLLPTQHDANSPCLEDPLSEGGVAISRGTLMIRLQYWLSCGGWGVTNRKFTFRYENSRFRLIGFDTSEFARNTGEKTESSINYLTGKIKITTGLNEFEDPHPRISWKTIPTGLQFFLENIRLDCGDYEPGFKC